MDIIFIGGGEYKYLEEEGGTYQIDPKKKNDAHLVRAKEERGLFHPKEGGGGGEKMQQVF